MNTLLTLAATALDIVQTCVLDLRYRIQLAQIYTARNPWERWASEDGRAALNTLEQEGDGFA
jgi:hypothetical protein